MKRYVQKGIRVVATPGRWGAYGAKLWVETFARLSRLPVVGAFCARLAAWGLGPYKAKRRVVRLTGRSYVSPRAQIHGSNLEVGERCFIDDDVTIYIADGRGRVVLDEGVYLYRGSILEVVKGGEIRIGSGTHIQPYCVLNSVIGKLDIGRNVQIAAHCGFFPYRHRIDDVDVPIQEQGFASKGGIVIDDDVWIGTGVKVMDGVHIGRGSVVGAGAVVTRDVPSYSVAVGNPARVVRRRTGRPTPPGRREGARPREKNGTPEEAGTR
jgi:acetyltransferase-like isoleucine patch superfamily enzyme